MSWKEEYQSKLVSCEKAAAKVKNGDRLWYGCMQSAPIDIGLALFKNYEKYEGVTVFGGLSLYPFDYLRGYAKGHFDYECVFLGPLERKFFPEGNINLTSYTFAHADDLTKNIIKPNIAIFEVSEPDENGYMSFGPIGNYNGYGIAQESETVIVQVNKNCPYVPGVREAFLHVSEVDYIVEKDHDIPELTNPPISDEDRKIAEFVANEIPDGACIQVGLGAIPDAVCYALTEKKDLGVHAEMISTGVGELMKKGVITCAKKNFHPGKIVTPMAPGTHALNEYIQNNEMMEMAPIAYVNNPAVAAKNDNLMAINGTLMVDLTGQICSESLGYDMISGTGGQLDYAIAADLSKGGKSFICLNSALKKGDRIESRIVSKLPAGTVVTTPRALADYIVTEYGIVQLKDKSIPERVNLMISIAHPEVREQLRKEAIEAGLIRE